MHQQIINILKEQYSRDVRKQVVKSMITNEKRNNKAAVNSSYKIINQIFSYVISELNWSISQNTNTWDDSPLKIISEVFPKIQMTKWFKDKELLVNKPINLKDNHN